MWWVTVNDFYRQMVEISGKEVVYLDDYNPENSNQVVITFDGIYDNVLFYAAPILKKFNYPFELFLTSEYIGKDNTFDTVEPLANFTSKAQLKELVKLGGRLQWHTKTHINLKDVSDISIINDELTVPDELLALDENGFKWFAYPHGELNDLVVDRVMQQFKGALSCHQGDGSSMHQLNRLTVVNSTKLSEFSIACIIASYNYGDFLIEAIESVLRQTIVPDEILITDDCSDDESQLISESYIKMYPGLIKYNRNSRNLGIVENFNKAARLINSDYIFFLGADNRLLSNYVEECYKVLVSDINIAIAYTDYALFGSRAKLIYDDFDEKEKGEIRDNIYYQINFPEFSDNSEMVNHMKERNFIHGSSMYKMSCFNQVNGYKRTDSAEDHNFFARILHQGWLAKKAKNTNLEYRQHSSSQANNVVVLYNKVQFYKREYELLLENRKLELLKKRNDEFETSNFYRISRKLHKYYKALRNNYREPLIIFKLIFRKIKRKYIKKKWN